MKAKPINIKTSGFGLLDVTTGRAALYKHLTKHNRPIKVVIEAEINDFWGDDDGISREFVLDIKKLKVKP